MHIHVHTHTDMHGRMSACTCTDKFTFACTMSMQADAEKLVHKYLFTYPHTCSASCLLKHLWSYTRTYIHDYIHTYIHIYIHTYIHEYIHTDIKPYTQTCRRADTRSYIPAYMHKACMQTNIHAVLWITHVSSLGEPLKASALNPYKQAALGMPTLVPKSSSPHQSSSRHVHSAGALGPFFLALKQSLNPIKP